MIIAGEDLLEIKDEGGDPAFGGNIEDGYFRDYHGNLFELNIPDELIDKYIAERDKKYYVQLFPGGSGYLNVDRADDRFLVQNSTPLDRYKTQFTNAEIEDLKTNPALKAINWDEVKLIPAD